MAEQFDHSDLTLHGRFTDDGSQYRLYVLLNGVELPVQFLNVHDYREKFDEAKQKASSDEQAPEQQ
jgi:hypothetical protein